MFIIDAHLDLAMNALEWNRDLTKSVEFIRERESGLTDKPDRAKGTVSFPALRKGGIGLVVATQIARYVDYSGSLPGWHSPEQAWAQTQGQLAWYKEMERTGVLKSVRNKQDLQQVVSLWQTALDKDDRKSSLNTVVKYEKELVDALPIGYIRSLEGADSIVILDHLHQSYEDGLRALGPAHYGPGRYAFGTDSSAPLSHAGKELLKEMQQLDLILDVTHLCDEAFWDALKCYQGPIWASHNNCRAIVNHNRQFSDEMIKALIDRGAVIGGALDAWMMVPDWKRGVTDPQSAGCDLNSLIRHMDHICQIAGNADHIGIGSDLDGAFGKEQTPYDLDDISDLQKLPGLFKKVGYSDPDIQKIMHGNWLGFLQNNL
ncbi:membrane dipeptidase [Arachidicoccus rhizosphaerae]|uniref:Membrane dipeptidase n=1 Tax=Arachidicoccus rhizosphaerae TaxID=551991 RepID=A0A1H4BIW0_9BACT|nr:membrane dipeptidase [Arachidicoccus rhizosphaerae]SEA48089.1 membrane dipeptidase [Arachidicoccus rhizosphaerae]